MTSNQTHQASATEILQREAQHAGPNSFGVAGTQLIAPPAPSYEGDPLLTADEVARRLKVSTDWVWDHSSRKKPYLPVIRMGDGTLRYRTSRIEAFIDERERLSSLGHRAR